MTETPPDVPQYVDSQYEDIVSKLDKESIKEYKDLVLFPDDNIEVQRLKKENLSGMKIIPDKIDGSLSLATKEIFNVFTQDLCVVNHKYKEYTKVSLDKNLFKKQKFKIDEPPADEKEKSKKKEKDGKKKETEKKSESRKESRENEKKMDFLHITPQDARQTFNALSMQRLFKLFDMIVDPYKEFDWAGGAEIKICKRFTEKKKIELKRDDPILIEIENFETALCKKAGQIEPLFLSMCLFDTQQRRRVSETFYFEFNGPNMLQLLNVQNPDPTTQIRNVVFKVSNRSPDIVLYIRILKVLQGDEEDATEPYMKPPESNDKIEKIRKQAAEYCSRLGAYRQTIAWTAFHMFEKGTELICPNEIEPFFRTKGNMSDAAFCTLFGTREGGSSKRLKRFPAKLQIKLTELTSYNPKYRDNQIVEIPSSDPNAPPIIAKEMIEFPTICRLAFHSHYVNYLYVCPAELSLPKRGLQTKYSRNIAVCIQVKESYDDLDAPGLPLIFGRDSTQPVLTDKQFTSITYHSRHPEFGDEFKIMLPPVITPLHHLLFTFYHVQCKQKSGKAKEHLIGYAIVPLLQDDMIVHGPVRAKLLAEFPSRQPYSEEGAKILDSGKKDFLINFNLVSTIYPNDKNIANFFNSFTLSGRSSMSQHTDPDLLLSQSIGALKKSPPELIVQYLPVIFNQLLKTICGIFKQSKFIAFKTLLHLLDMVSSLSTTESGRNKHLMKYLNEYFTNFKDIKTYVFEELTQQWLIMLQESKQKRRNYRESNKSTQESAEDKYPLVYSWFLFDTIYKSMVLYLDDKKELLGDRKQRFSNEFHSVLEKLVTIMAEEIIYRSGAGLNLAKLLNSNLALFLRDLLNVMDRGFILTLIRKFLATTTVSSNFEVLQEFRVTFLEIIVDYEHLIPMCLPVDYNNIGNAEKMHDRFLAGILLEQCKTDLIYKERFVRIRVLNLLRQVLTKIEYDERYQSEQARMRVATIFFPFVLSVIELFEEFKQVAEDKLNRLKKEENDKNAELSDITNSIAKRLESQDKEQNKTQMDEQHINKLKEEEKRARKDWEESKYQYEEEMKRVKEEYQLLLVCLLYIIKNSHRDLLKSWWRAAPKSDIATFLNILYLCLEIFEYPGKEKIAEKAKTGIGTSTTKSLSEAKSKLENMYTSLDRRTNLSRSGTLRKGGTLTRNFKVQTFTKTLTIESPKMIEPEDIENMVLWEGNMSTESAINVIEILHDFVLDYKNELSETESKDEEIIRKRLFAFVERLLADYQSEKALICAFTFLKIFIQEYGSLIYSTGTDTPFSETLCNSLLAHCYSPYSDVRIYATALLYTLLKNEYLKNGNFSKTKTQTTLALSKLVPYIDQAGIKLLSSAFNAISQFATADEELPKITQKKIQETGKTLRMKENVNFAKEVQQLVERLNKTLLDTKRLEKTNAANEMRADLYLNIAKGYRHTPELSVTWYENLADYHAKNERWVEAAQCIIYIAAVSYQYLKLSKNPITSLLDYNYMEKVSPNLKNEQFDDLKLLFLENEKPHFESNHFFESGFVRLIKKAIEYFNKDLYFEYSIYMYKMLLVLYEKSKNYEELQKIHYEISQLYGNIAKANLGTSRLFGTFYRVGFYGKRFSEDAEDINGTEFIYKMPKITRLAEMIDYFKKQYGSEKLKIIGENHKVEGLTEQDEFAYIQITSVQPYYEPEELNERVTYFEKFTNLNKFIFETPFTLSGKPQSNDLTDQYKRKTILTIENPFPGVMTRTRILKKEEIIVTPIENAIDIIDTCIDRLKDAIDQARKRSNVNYLHLALSGTVIPQVNLGVPQIINSFVNVEKAEEKFDKNFLAKLKLKLRDFLSYCNEGIICSSKCLSAEQVPLHREFEKGYDVLYNMFSECVPGIEDLKRKV